MHSTLILSVIPLASAALSSITQNDFVNGGACKQMTVLFARGTTEAGNMGSATGPPFVTAIGEKLGAGNVAVQGIDYPADVAGFLAGGDAGGSQTMAKLVGQVRAKCPDTSLVISGYSQGGQVVHKAAATLGTEDTAFVSSAVIFGDPDNGQAVGSVPAAKTKIICHTGDLICAGQAIILAAHLTYAMDADTAAEFVVGNMGASSKTGTASAEKKARRERRVADARAEMESMEAPRVKSGWKAFSA